MSRLNSSSSGGRLNSSSSRGRLGSTKKTDPLTNVEGLYALAAKSGLQKQADAITNREPKLSALQRLSKGLGAFNPAEAFLTGAEHGAGAGIFKYGEGIVKGIGSAVTGNDYEGERRTFRHVAQAYGVENEYAQKGIGFLGDVLLDPTTYFGGAMVRGVGFVAKGIGNTTLKSVGKVAPATETGLRMAGQGLKDAVGKAFVFAYKSSNGASADVLTFLSKKQKAQLGLASSNLARLGTGALSKSQQEELALKLIAGKRAEFGAREAGKSLDEAATVARETAQSADPLVQKAIAEQSARSKKLGGEVVENPYETYFPFLRKDKLQTFILETRGIKVGSESYRKQFKNVLTDENIIKDPAEAFFTRESQIVSDRMTRDFLTGFVGKHGKPLSAFKSSDEAEKAGFSLIREKGTFGKELGYVSTWDAKLIRDAISPEFATLDVLARATYFDQVTSLFKRSVTGLFLPFHVRNFVSGHVQNFEVLGISALNPKAISAGQKVALMMAKGQKLPTNKITVAGKQMSFATAMKPFVDRFSGDTFYNADFQFAVKHGGQLKSAAKTLSKTRVKETAKTLGLGNEAIPFKVARTVGQYIEHQQKATAYIVALEQGKNVREALALAEKAGFDYRALTRFESQIMRRLIPFYSFTRKNLELQLKTLGENPQRINNVLNFFDNGAIVGTPIGEEERKALPEYLQDSLGVRLGDNPDGLRQYVSSFGTPIEAFAQLFREGKVMTLISMSNPLIKAPTEIGIGKDTFRRRDVKDVYTAHEYNLAPQPVKDFLQIKEVQKPILKKGADGKVKKVGERTTYVADPERLLVARALFTSRGFSFFDQVFDSDLEGFAKWMKVTTGAKPQPVDLDAEAVFREKKQERELEDLLQRYGEVAKFQRVFIPKE